MGRIYGKSALEKKMACKVFKLYLESEDIVDYNKKISDLSTETGLSEEILRSFRYLYYDEYATESEKKLYNTCKSKDRIPNYILVLDEIFELPEEDRAKCLFSKGIRLYEIKDFFVNYKKNNGKYSSLVDDFSKQYVNYVKEYNKNAVENRNNEIFDEACSSYDDLVELGFYNSQDYIQYTVEGALENSLEFKKYVGRFISYKKTLNGFNPNLWDYYSMKMEENRSKAFYLMKDTIDAFLKRVQNTIYGIDNVDIIDYYMAIGMSLADFKKLCKDYVGFSGINSLFGPYLKMELNKIIMPKIDSEYVFNGRTASLDDKMNVLNFLYQNNIPYIYFNNALKKYFDGGLDQYIDSDKKLTLCNK